MTMFPQCTVTELQEQVTSLQKMLEAQQAEMAQASVRYKAMEETLAQHTQMVVDAAGAKVSAPLSAEGVPALSLLMKGAAEDADALPLHIATESIPALSESEQDARATLRDFYKETELDQEDGREKGKGMGKGSGLQY